MVGPPQGFLAARERDLYTEWGRAAGPPPSGGGTGGPTGAFSAYGPACGGTAFETFLGAHWGPPRFRWAASKGRNGGGSLGWIIRGQPARQGKRPGDPRLRRRNQQRVGPKVGPRPEGPGAKRDNFSFRAGHRRARGRGGFRGGYSTSKWALRTWILRDHLPKNTALDRGTPQPLRQGTPLSSRGFPAISF